MQYRIQIRQKCYKTKLNPKLFIFDDVEQQEEKHKTYDFAICRSVGMSVCRSVGLSVCRSYNHTSASSER